MKLNIVKKRTTESELQKDIESFFSCNAVKVSASVKAIVNSIIYDVQLTPNYSEAQLREMKELGLDENGCFILSVENLRELADHLYIPEYDLRIY